MLLRFGSREVGGKVIYDNPNMLCVCEIRGHQILFLKENPLYVIDIVGGGCYW